MQLDLPRAQVVHSDEKVLGHGAIGEIHWFLVLQDFLDQGFRFFLLRGIQFYGFIGREIHDDDPALFSRSQHSTHRLKLQSLVRVVYRRSTPLLEYSFH